MLRNVACYEVNCWYIYPICYKCIFQCLRLEVLRHCIQVAVDVSATQRVTIEIDDSTTSPPSNGTQVTRQQRTTKRANHDHSFQPMQNPSSFAPARHRIIPSLSLLFHKSTRPDASATHTHSPRCLRHPHSPSRAADSNPAQRHSDPPHP